MKILYIAGLAHSGSTYLSRVLNQHSEVFSMGEVVFLPRALFEEPNCACRESPESRCEFWSRIKKRLDIDPPKARDIAHLSEDNRLEWIKALGSWYGKEGPDSFPESNRRFLNAVAEDAGAGVVLDASKTVWRALPLWRAFPDDMYLLHLMKAPENQLESRLRMGYNFWHSLFLKYVRKNWLYSHLFSSRPTYKRVIFENLVNHPEQTLREVHEWLDLPYQDPFERPFQPFHHLAGNTQVTGHMETLRPKEEKLNTHHTFAPHQQRVIRTIREFMYEPALRESKIR